MEEARSQLKKSASTVTVAVKVTLNPSKKCSAMTYIQYVTTLTEG